MTIEGQGIVTGRGTVQVTENIKLHLNEAATTASTSLTELATVTFTPGSANSVIFCDVQFDHPGGGSGRVQVEVDDGTNQATTDMIPSGSNSAWASFIRIWQDPTTNTALHGAGIRFNGAGTHGLSDPDATMNANWMGSQITVKFNGVVDASTLSVHLQVREVKAV